MFQWANIRERVILRSFCAAASQTSVAISVSLPVLAPNLAEAEHYFLPSLPLGFSLERRERQNVFAVHWDDGEWYAMMVDPETGSFWCSIDNKHKALEVYR